MDKQAFKLRNEIISILNEYDLPMYLKYYIMKDVTEKVQNGLMGVLSQPEQIDDNREEELDG